MAKKRVLKVRGEDEALINEVLDRAILEVKDAAIRVFTFAAYHDHESGAVSVCVDTRANSADSIARSNRFTARSFRQAVQNNDLEMAALWTPKFGHSLSLGDFAKVNVARADLDDPEVGEPFYRALIQALVAREAEVRRLADDPNDLLFCCSGPKAEVEFTWMATPSK
jgi:hypothetical protein